MKASVNRFKGFYGTLSFSMAIYGAFAMLFLRNKGFSNAEIGLITSLNMGISILSQLFWRYMCDVKKTIKKLLVFTMAVLIGIAIIALMISGGKPLIIVLAVFTFFNAPLGFLMEMWILQSEKEISRNYGSIRAFASAGWALCGLVMGQIIERLGWNSIFIFYAAFMALMIFMSRNMKDIQVEVKSSKASNAQEKVNPFILFKDFRYLLVVLIAVFIFLSQMVLTFLAIVVEELGGNSTHLGISTFVMAASELPLFFLANRLMKKYKLTNLALFTAVAYIVRMAMLFFATSYVHVILLGVFQAITFPFMDITRKYMIIETAPENLKNTAQSLANSICSATLIVYSAFAGFLTDAFSVKIIFLVGGISAFLALLLVILYKSLYEKKAVTSRVTEVA